MRFAALFCALAVAAAAQTAAAAPDRNPKLGRGVNILGYDPIWDSFDKARFKARYFRMIKDGGFDTIRVNLQPFLHMGAGPDYRMSDAWYRTLDWIVTNGLKARLNVILDLHEFRAMAGNPEGQKGKFLAFWRQISPRFKRASRKVIFEVLNEPNGNLTPQLWNQYLAEALDIIRADNPTRTVIVGGANWNSIDSLRYLQLPEGDRNLVVTVHFYEPMSFTHQGADWTNQVDKVGIEWKGAAEEQAAIARRFQLAQDWATEHKRRLFLGEFGAYDKGPMESRVRWSAAVARAAERLGWAWAYWQFDSDFVLYDVASDQWVEPIRAALAPGR